MIGGMGRGRCCFRIRVCIREIGSMTSATAPAPTPSPTQNTPASSLTTSSPVTVKWFGPQAPVMTACGSTATKMGTALWFMRMVLCMKETGLMGSVRERVSKDFMAEFIQASLARI